MINLIFLRRYNKVIVEEGYDTLPDVYIATLLKNLEHFGYTLSGDILDVLRTFDMSKITQFYEELISNIKILKGAHVKYQPMYPNFPTQVMEMDETELYMNAIVHYLSNGHLLPSYEYKERFPLLDTTKLTTINLGTSIEFIEIYENLLESRSALSETDKEEFIWLFENQRSAIKYMLPYEIPFKENLVFISKLLLEYPEDDEDSTNEIYDLYDTATDVLRLAVAMSDGDISLATNTRFRSFSRKERRMLLELLSGCKNLSEEMLKYKGQWIRLGERLHPGEYKNTHENVKKAFDDIRNSIKIETYNGKVEKLFNGNNEQDLDDLIKLLENKPGIFARKLDHLLRNKTDYMKILEGFSKIVPDVSTVVLLQVLAHFKNRNEGGDIRTFFPKGNIAKIKVIENKLPILPAIIVDTVFGICENELISRFSTRESLGKVYIDRRLRDHFVPFAQRSASKSFRTLTRGSRIDIPTETTTIRSFVYWKEALNDRTDIDLSVVIYDSEWERLQSISYKNLRDSNYNVYHSGDITSAPNGASEFIDIDINSIKKNKGRYVTIVINLFTDQTFDVIPECFMGLMNRQHPGSGEIYEPKTVSNIIDITSNSKICIPMILDLSQMKNIWADITLKQNPKVSNNVDSNSNNLPLMGKAITQLVKPTLYDLFLLHCTARGTICNDIDKADTVFSMDRGLTPYDIDKIISEYL